MDDAGETVFSHLTGFTDALRAAGLNITPYHTMTWLEAASIIRFEDLSEIYWAGRSALVERPEDVDLYDDVFRQHFSPQRYDSLGMGEVRSRGPSNDEDSAVVDNIASTPDKPNETIDVGEPVSIKAAYAEVMKTKGIYPPNADEEAYIRKITALATNSPPVKRSRRFRLDRNGKHVDMRSSIARSLRTDGELIRLVRKGNVTKKRSILVLVDMSGSMQMQFRANLYFCYALVRAHSSTRCFCVGTRMTDISQYLRTPNVALALEEMSRLVIDWDGGTRLGDGVREFLDYAEHASSLNGGEVVVVSDGLERGEPDHLISAVRDMARRAGRVNWLSPLASSATYTPTTRAMKGIVPIVGKIYPAATIQDIYFSLSTVWRESTSSVRSETARQRRILRPIPNVADTLST